MFRESTSFRIIKTPSSSKSFSRTRQKTSPNQTDNRTKQAHIMLAQTTSRLKQPVPMRTKFVPPIQTRTQTNRLNLQIYIEQLKLQNKQLKQQNKLLEGEISVLRVMSQSDQAQKESMLVKKLFDAEHQFSNEKIRLQDEIQKQKNMNRLLKINNLKMINQEQSKQKLEWIYKQFQSMTLLKKQQQKSSDMQSIYNEIVNNKNAQILSLSQQISQTNSLLKQINTIIGSFDVEYSLLPQKLKYLIQFKSSEKSKQIELLEKEKEDLNNQIEKKCKDIEDMKSQFALKVQEISSELNVIIQNMKKQFDALKVQNWILSEENRQLMSKSQIRKMNKSYVSGQFHHKQTVESNKKLKAETVRDIQTNLVDQKEKPMPLNVPINNTKSSNTNTNLFLNANVDLNTNTDTNLNKNSNNTLIKTSTMKSFSHWIYQWSHSSSDQDRVILLSLLLQKKQFLKQSISKSLGQLASLIYSSLASTNNTQIHTICISLILECINNKILEEHGLYIQKIIPIILSLIQVRQQDVIVILFNVLKLIPLSKTIIDNINKYKVLSSLRECFRSGSLRKQILEMLHLFSLNKVMVSQLDRVNFDEQIIGQLQNGQNCKKEILDILHNLLSHQQYVDLIKTNHSSQKERNILKSYKCLLKLIHTQYHKISLSCLKILLKLPEFIQIVDKLPLISQILLNIERFPELEQLLDVIFKETSSQEFETLLLAFQPLISSLQKYQSLEILLKVMNKSKKNNTKQFDAKCIIQILQLVKSYSQIPNQNRIIIAKIVKIIIDRNKEIVLKALQDNTQEHLVTSYIQFKSESPIFISMIQLMIDLKKPEIQSKKIKLIHKLIEDSINDELKIRTTSLRNLINLSKQQDFQSNFKLDDTLKLFSHFKEFKDEESTSLGLSLIYFLCYIPRHSEALLPQFMKTMMKVLFTFASLKSIILKALTVIEKVHIQNYNRFITNQIVEEQELKALSVINRFLLGAENKKEMADHALFLYKSLNNPIPIEILANNISKKKCQVVNEMFQLGRLYTISNTKLGGVIKQILTEMGRFNKKIKEELESLEKKVVFER